MFYNNLIQLKHVAFAVLVVAAMAVVASSIMASEVHADRLPFWNKNDMKDGFLDGNAGNGNDCCEPAP
jgi:hypothetical protein